MPISARRLLTPTIGASDDATATGEDDIGMDDDDISDAEFDAIQSAFTQQSDGSPEHARDAKRVVFKDICRKMGQRRKQL